MHDQASRYQSFDADALTLIAENKQWLVKQGDIVLTPHLGEFSRLCNLTVTRSSDICLRADLFRNTASRCCSRVQQRWSSTATRSFRNGGHARHGARRQRRRAGKRDWRLMCGGHKNGMSFAAAVYGAYICGKAGEIATKDCGVLSMTPTDTLANIPLITRDMVKK